MSAVPESKPCGLAIKLRVVCDAEEVVLCGAVLSVLDYCANCTARCRRPASRCFSNGAARRGHAGLKWALTAMQMRQTRRSGLIFENVSSHFILPPPRVVCATASLSLSRCL